MHRLLTAARLLGMGLGFLTGCASLEDMRLMELAVKNADAKAEQALALAQASRSEAVKAIQTSDLALKAACEVKSMSEKAQENPYLPQ